VIKCEACSEVRNERILAKTAHVPDETKWEYLEEDGTVYKESCEDYGIKVAPCRDCGALQYDFIAPTGHNWGEGVVETEPTCTKEGSKWIECDRLFTKTDGSPMGMRQPYKFFERFCKKTGMRFVNIHSFRHFNASILISNGVDVKTVQGCLGHSSATTTLNIYAHSFQAAQVRAMDSVADCILKRDTKSSA
jgi:hypothetical protein